MSLIDSLRTALASHVGQAIAAGSSTHVCTSSCMSPCPNTGKSYACGAAAIPSDDVLLEWAYLPNGGRHIVHMPVTALATFLASATLPLTHATATAALSTFETANGGAGSTGLQKYLDQWHTEGLLT